MSRRTPLPSHFIRRFLTKEEAADFYGMDVSTFERAVKDEKVPPATRFGDRCLRWDLHVLHHHADKQAGLLAAAAVPVHDDVKRSVMEAISGAR